MQREAYPLETNAVVGCSSGLIAPPKNTYLGTDKDNGSGRRSPMMDRSMGDLVAAIALRGDRGAFAQLFAHFAPRVKAYARRLGANDESAEDLVQEVMLLIWRRAQQYDPKKAAASTWIFTIARNRYIDSLRRQQRPEIDPNDPMLVPSQEPAADYSLQTRQEDARLHAAMRGLPQEQVRLVQLSYFEGKSQSEIAGDLDLPLGTVKSRLRLALKKLRTTLGDLD